MKTERQCPNCKAIRQFKHTHKQAHGISGTHMAGSEKFECEGCGYAIFASDNEPGFPFTYDK